MSASDSSGDVNPTLGPCNDPTDPSARNDNGFEERWALLTIPKAGVLYLAVGTNHPHSNVDVYVSTFNDPNLYGATIEIYAKTVDAGRWLAFSGNLSGTPAVATGTQHFTASAACDGFDVFLGSSTPSTAGYPQIQVTAIAYGWEGTCCTGGGGGGGDVELSGQVTSPLTALPGPVPTTIVAQEDHVLYVSLTGDDSTGNGNLFNPFATYAKASTVAESTWSPTATTCAAIHFEPGHYSENIELKPNILVVGDLSDLTVLTGNITLHSSFTGSSEMVTGFAYVQMGGSLTVDFLTAAATDASASFDSVVLPPTTTFIGQGTSSNALEFFACEMSGDVTFQDLQVSSAGTNFESVTLDAAAYGAAWGSFGDTTGGAGSGAGNVSLVGTAFAATAELVNTGVYGTVSLDGTLASYQSTVEGVGSSIVLSGGASQPTILGSGNATSGQTLIADGAGHWTFGGVSGGITELTQDVLAGPGSGSVPATVVQLTGSSGVVDVVSGTALDFLTTGHVTSTNGRINFVGDVAGTLLAYHYSGSDYPAVSTDGVGSLYLGNNPPYLAAVANEVVLDGSGNLIQVTSIRTVFDVTAANFTASPTTFDDNSPVDIESYILLNTPLGPPLGPSRPVLFEITDETTTGKTLCALSNQGMLSQFVAAGSSTNDFALESALEIVNVPASGGTGTASLPLIPATVTKIVVQAVGSHGSGASGFHEAATCTVKVDSGGTASFVSAVTGNSNPDINPNLDWVSDGTFNSLAGGPSSIALSVSGGSLVVTFTNAGTTVNTVLVTFSAKGFAS